MNLESRKKRYRAELEQAAGVSEVAGVVAGGGPGGVEAFEGVPENRILTGDCVAAMNAMPAGCVDLVFADPPFNIGYLYGKYDDNKTTEEYCKFCEQWMAAVHRVLSPTGSFFLAIGDEYAADLTVIARRKLGFNMRNWIIWHYTFGQQTKLKFAKSHTHILYFTKDEKEFTFNADPVRVASARQTTYADLRANPKGKLPDDTWYLRPQEAAAEMGGEPGTLFAPDVDVWNESRVCGTFGEREGWHGCQMPLAVLDRIIKAASNPGDLVLDPFNGSGTTVVSAAQLGRRYIGIDLDPAYVSHAEKRLAGVLGKGPVDSRVKASTDAFGRDRVERKRGGRGTL
jgi:site-specific DNA-methyltransferase (adenine-specific)